jgi:N-acetylglutamate synthase-like GNAT family acetyltransferase
LSKLSIAHAAANCEAPLINAGGVYTKARWKMRHKIKPGDIGYLVYLHGTLYAKEYGYDQTFEAYVANGLAKFVKKFKPDTDRIWLAETAHRVIGSVAIVGHSKADAQLRWFLVHPDYRGLGIGKELLKEALQFCKEHKYRTIFLWTTNELAEATHLYTQFGFTRTEAKTHRIWGKRVTEERYDLVL